MGTTQSNPQTITRRENLVKFVEQKDTFDESVSRDAAQRLHKTFGLSPENMLSVLEKRATVPPPDFLETKSFTLGSRTVEVSFGEYAGFSVQNRKSCQDRVLVDEIIVKGAKMVVIAVFDGHGAQGEYVSDYCKENLCDVLTKHLNDEPSGSMPRGLVSAFLALDKSMYRSFFFTKDVTYNGTTATVALLQCSASPKLKDGGVKIHMAHVGDSTAIIGSSDPDIRKQTGLYSLTRNHSLFHKDEADRVIKSGGIVKQMSDSNGDSQGPLRVYFKHQEGPGLAVSRSLGDVAAHTIGVTSEPEVLDGMELFEHEDVIVVASDGVWDMLTAHQVFRIIDTDGCSELACTNVMRESCKRWVYTRPPICDDISLAIVQIKNSSEQ